MRRPVLALMTGLTALVVGLGIRAGAAPLTHVAGAAAPTGVVTSTSSAAPSASVSKQASSRTVNGDAVQTRYGPVQVQITVKSGRITAADAIAYPTQDPRDQEINGWAIPQLGNEAVQAQSAQIDAVSGATFTSEGYLGSLQSAIDAARSAGLL